MSGNDDLFQRFEIHPDYPFVKVGLLKEFTGDCGNPDEWILLIDNECSHVVYGSKEDAIKDADECLYLKSDGYSFALNKIQSAINDGDVALAVLMSERLGYAKGMDSANESFKKDLIKSKAILKRWLK